MVGGVVMMAASLLLGVLFGAFRRVKNQGSATGEIVSLDYRYDSDERKPTYTAILEYTVAGKVYSVRSSYRSSRFRTGQRKKVLYNREDPAEAFVRPGAALFVVMAALFLAGAALMARSAF